MIYSYFQSSGNFVGKDGSCSSGYSGYGDGKNNPADQQVEGQGPIPAGFYTIGPPEDHPKLGPLAYPLIPSQTNKMFGRSEFFIHGDSAQHPGDASHGCIILPHDARASLVPGSVLLVTA